jgi:hypothetical protein
LVWLYLPRLFSGLIVAGFPQFKRALFFIAKYSLAFKQQVPIDMVPVEFGPVDTDKLGNSVYGDAAAAAHAGAIDHNGVETNDGCDTKRLGG